MSDEFIFYGEWVFLDDESEREDALQYLNLWKKFILRKFVDCEFVEDQIIYKPGLNEVIRPTLGIKICIKHSPASGYMPHPQPIPLG